MCSLLPSPPKYCLLHPSPPFFSELCVGRWGWGFVHLPLAFLMSFTTYSGLGEDGLGLGFLGRHHWTLLTIPTKPELLNKHGEWYWKICLYCLSSLFNPRRLAWLWKYMIKGGLYVLCCEHLLAASALYQGARPNHQHQADQHDQEAPAIQKGNHQIDNMITFNRFIWTHVRKKNILNIFLLHFLLLYDVIFML